MTHQQKLIVIGGAGVAFLILRPKLAGAKPKTTAANKTGASGGLLSTLFPTRGTNSPGVASTNMATRNGTATGARVPSSGLGFPGGTGAAQAPSTVGGIAAGAGAALKGLFDFLARKPATGAAPQPQRSSGGGSSGGGGSSSGTAPRGGMGGAAGVAGQQYDNGYFDQNGNWVGRDGYYDENGNFIPTDAGGNVLGSTEITPGYFDEAGNWVATDPGTTDVQPGYFDEAGNWQLGDDPFAGDTPITSGAFDENGNWNPDAEPGLETGASDDVLPSTPIGTGDFYDTGFVDPVTFDQGASEFPDSDLSSVDAGSFDDFT